MSLNLFGVFTFPAKI